ncbi:MAG: peptidase [Verrucomicrobia bacterium]|nr:peptidase [Verrucomicrobiota bacterium]
MESPIPILIGVETEYGIHVERSEGEGEPDVVADSIALVRCASEPGVWMVWDYSAEDPHRDARGFHVDQLRQDTDEAAYVDQDARRELSYVEVKSDLALSNGGRFYNDHAHPEFCTPECATPGELAQQDRAGEWLVRNCARTLGGKLGRPVRIYKNNTDFQGHSYGCHENYLLPRALPWEKLARAMQAFLVTRQIYAGAGKFGWEAEDRFLESHFQISQRADFFSELQSVDTMQRRPLINTRDEPHANPSLYRRFHVILGDANMSPFATRLKVGATALVLEAAARAPDLDWPVLEHPLEAVRSISRDPDFAWKVRCERNRFASALEVQSWYLEMAGRWCNTAESWKTALMSDWAQVMKDLAEDPFRCRHRLDWPAKLHWIRRFQRDEGLSDSDPWLRSLDLQYHLLDPAEGLFAALESSGEMEAGEPDEASARALRSPPAITRAAVRGKLIEKFPARVLAAQWDHVLLEGKAGVVRVDLTDLFAPDDISRYLQRIEAARAVDDLRGLDD